MSNEFIILQKTQEDHDRRIVRLENDLIGLKSTKEQVAVLENSHKELRQDVNNLQSDLKEVASLLKEETENRRNDFRELTGMLIEQKNVLVRAINTKADDFNRFKWWLLTGLIVLLLGMVGTAFYGSINMQNWIDYKMNPVKIGIKENASSINKNGDRIIDIYEKINK